MHGHRYGMPASLVELNLMYHSNPTLPNLSKAVHGLLLSRTFPFTLLLAKYLEFFTVFSTRMRVCPLELRFFFSLLILQLYIHSKSEFRVGELARLLLAPCFSHPGSRRGDSTLVLEVSWSLKETLGYLASDCGRRRRRLGVRRAMC